MLRVENLDLFYGDAQALADVSLEIGEGSIVAIVGANGAGKTSLIRTIAGMLAPARGRIMFHDTDITGWESHRVCNLGIGQVAEGRPRSPRTSISALCLRAPARAERGILNACLRFSPCSPSAQRRRRARYRAASSRCLRSGVASWERPIS